MKLRMPRRQLFVAAVAMGVLFIGFIGVRFFQPAGHVAQKQGKAVYYCPMHPGYTSDRPGDCLICYMKLVKRDTGSMESRAPSQEKKEKKILYWTDPMIPGYKSDKPGKSPMGMDLVPVHEEGEAGMGGEGAPSGYAPVQITPQRQQLIGIKTARAAKRALTKVIRTVGRIAFDPELYQAQEEYLQAVRALEEAQSRAMPQIVEQAQRVVDAAQIRLRLLGVNDDVIKETRKSGKPDRSLLLNDARKGVWLYAPIYEFELPFVKAGQTISVEIPSIPGKTFEGIIQSIDPVLDPMTRSARVRALLKDPEGDLKPQMFVNASLQIELGEVLAVPEEAVFDTGTRRIIFVDKGEGKFEPREVTVGAKAEGAYELKTGITEGEVVVIRGNFLIDSESRLKAATEGMMIPPSEEAKAPAPSKEEKAAPAASGKEHAGPPHGH